MCKALLSRIETHFYHTCDLRLREAESGQQAGKRAATKRRMIERDGGDGKVSLGGLPGRIGIKVANIMRSHRNQGNAFLRGITSGTFTDGASRLSMPSATVRHHARLWEENG